MILLGIGGCHIANERGCDIIMVMGLRYEFEERAVVLKRREVLLFYSRKS